MSEIAVAIISGLCVAVPNIIATISSNKKNNDLMIYRIQQLETKVDKHNTVVERTYKLEGQMSEIEHDIQELKRA